MTAATWIDVGNDLIPVVDATNDDTAAILPPPAEGETRQLLRWLRNLQSLDLDIEQWLQQTAPDTQRTRITPLCQLARHYAAYYQQTKTSAPARLQDVSIEEANDAVNAIALAILDHAIESLPEGHPDITQLEALLLHLPKRAHLRATQSVERLVAILAAGIECASGKQDELTPVDRLNDASKRIHITATKLEAVEKLEPPVREESIDLAHEILRRLRDITFDKQAKEERIDTGKPEEKAALAQRIDEVLDMYKNLLSEALQINPTLLVNNLIIKHASDAASTFDHAIKLMAAKEMPGSMAATQQISAADAAQATMDAHTLERLLKSIEAGIDQAANILETEQNQSQQRSEEAGQTRAAEAAQQAEQSGRKRKRRNRSGSGGAKQLKTMRDLNADDFALKQGRFNEGSSPADLPEKPNALAGLKLEDLAVIRQLGGSLNNYGKEASTLAPPPDPKKPQRQPSDKNFTDRGTKEERKNASKQGPAV